MPVATSSHFELTLPALPSVGIPTPLSVHPQWVRERCRCCTCLDPSSKQANFGIDLNKQHALELFQVKEAVVNSACDGWKITFGDGHTVALDGARSLAEHKSFDTAGAVQCEGIARPERVLWSKKTFSLKKFQWDTLHMNSGDPVELVSAVSSSAGTGSALAAEACKARAEVLETLLTYGLCVIQGVPCEDREILRFSKNLVGHVRDTHWGQVFDVVAEPAADARADQAYTSVAIDFHVDNPYRCPAVDFQLLHCLKNSGGVEGEGMNRFVDADYCANLLRETDPAAFDLLKTVPLKWENDFPMSHLQPTLQMDVSGNHVNRVFISAKSGGFAPPLPPAKLEAFYAAKREFVRLLDSPENIVTYSTSPGDLVMFVNTRVLHARTSFDSSKVSRHLQGLYFDYDAVESSFNRYRTACSSSVNVDVDRDNTSTVDPQASARGTVDVAKADTLPTWTSLENITPAQIDVMNAKYKDDNQRYQVERILDMLRRQRGKHCELGAPVDLYTHGLQTATRAHAAGESEDLVVGGLLHDVGELLTPSNHGEIAAGLLAPYVDPSIHWIIKHHEIFQMYYYGEQCGLDKNVRERFKDSPHYEATVKFCSLYDQAAFDPNYESKPLSFFEPMVRRVFSRKPYWHTPDHPKAGAVLAGASSADK